MNRASRRAARLARPDELLRIGLVRYLSGDSRLSTPVSELGSILVSTTCRTCGARITAAYAQIRTIGIFACGCGTAVDADMHAVATQAVIALIDEAERPAPVLDGAGFKGPSALSA